MIIVKKLSYDYLFDRFIAGVEKTKNVNYLNKNSIKRNNKGVDEYRKAATQISELYPEHIGKFSSLLDSNDIKERVTCAICMIELMKCSYEQRRQAFSVITEYYNSSADEADKMMIDMWLIKYRNLK